MQHVEVCSKLIRHPQQIICHLKVSKTLQAAQHPPVACQRWAVHKQKQARCGRRCPGKGQPSRCDGAAHPAPCLQFSTGLCDRLHHAQRPVLRREHCCRAAGAATLQGRALLEVHLIHSTGSHHNGLALDRWARRCSTRLAMLGQDQTGFTNTRQQPHLSCQPSQSPPHGPCRPPALAA